MTYLVIFNLSQQWMHKKINLFPFDCRIYVGELQILFIFSSSISDVSIINTLKSAASLNLSLQNVLNKGHFALFNDYNHVLFGLRSLNSNFIAISIFLRVAFFFPRTLEVASPIKYVRKRMIFYGELNSLQPRLVR